jgi:hypothetical protein
MDATSGRCMCVSMSDAVQPTHAPIPELIPTTVERYHKRPSANRALPERHAKYGIAGTALDWCAQWSKPAYPGRRKLFLELLPRAVTWGAVRHWLFGRVPLPPDVAASLEAHIRARCAEGLAIADALADCQTRAASVIKRKAGAFTVDETTGRDKRGYWKR